jgi:hypothetical protein
MTAKYETSCIICAGMIRCGTEICWRKGQGTWHATCDGKPPAPLNSPAPAQTLSPDVDLVALAASHGHTLVGQPKIETFISQRKVGETFLSRGRLFLVLAAGPEKYYSASYLEDCDMFGIPPGRYAKIQTVEVAATAEEIAVRIK